MNTTTRVLTTLTAILVLFLATLYSALAYKADFVFDQNLTFKNRSVTGSWGLKNASFLDLNGTTIYDWSGIPGTSTFSCAGGNSTHANVTNSTTSQTCILVARNPGAGGGSFDLWRLQISGENINSITNNTLVRLHAVGATWTNDSSNNYTLTVSQGFNQSVGVANLETANVTNNGSITALIAKVNSLVNLTLAQVLSNGFINVSSGVWTGNITILNNLVTENASLWTNASAQAGGIQNLQLANQTTNASVTNLIKKDAQKNLSIGNSTFAANNTLDTQTVRFIAGRNVSSITIENNTAGVNITINTIDTDTNTENGTWNETRGNAIYAPITTVTDNQSWNETRAKAIFPIIGSAQCGGTDQVTNITANASGLFVLCSAQGSGGGMSSWVVSNGSATFTVTDSMRINITAGTGITINQTGGNLTVSTTIVDTDTNSGYTQWQYNSSGNATTVAVTNNTLVSYIAGTGITINHVGTNITVTNTVTDTDTNSGYTQWRLNTSGNATTVAIINNTLVSLIAGAGLTINHVGNNVTIVNTVTDTDTHGNISVGNGSIQPNILLDASRVRLLPGRNVTLEIANDSDEINITIHAIDTTGGGGFTNGSDISVNYINATSVNASKVNTSSLFAGTVNFTTSIITEGTNLYYTDARATSAVQNTTILRNGTNANFATLNASTLNVGTFNFTTTQVPEGTNLYFTTQRAGDAVVNTSILRNGTQLNGTQVYVGTLSNSTTKLLITGSSNVTNVLADSAYIKLLNTNVSNNQLISNNNYMRIDFATLNTTGTEFLTASIISINRLHSNATTGYQGDLAFLTMKSGTPTEQWRITAEGDLNSTGGGLLNVGRTNLTTTQITEGTNLYYTDARAAAAVQNTSITRNGTSVNFTRGIIQTLNNLTSQLLILTSSNTSTVTTNVVNISTMFADQPLLELSNQYVNQTHNLSNNVYARLDFTGFNFSGTKFIFASIIGIQENHTNSTTGVQGNLAFATLRNGNITEAARLDENGRFGIGAIAPTQTLDVNGSLNMSGNITFYNSGTAKMYYNGSAIIISS